jgi:hypothetical protein
MPRVKRWSPISHNFNRDPQVLEMRKRFGDWTALAWIEVLHEADRNEGVVMGSLDEIAYQVSAVSLAEYRSPAAKKAKMMLEYCLNLGWIRLENGQKTVGKQLENGLFQPFSDRIEVVNYLKYHKTREHKEIPTRPNHTIPYKKEEEDTEGNAVPSGTANESLSIKDLVESWNEIFNGKLPRVTWPLSDHRRAKVVARLREHPQQEFWQHVFDTIGGSGFLLGLANGKGHGKWKCTFDFLIENDTNAVKIFEGGYGG